MPFKSTNLFAQIIDLADRDAFRRIVRKHGGDRFAKGFTCWDQLVSMLFCQLGKAQSLPIMISSTGGAKLGSFLSTGRPGVHFDTDVFLTCGEMGLFRLARE
jgi:hypothetical protein